MHRGPDVFFAELFEKDDNKMRDSPVLRQPGVLLQVFVYLISCWWLADGQYLSIAAQRTLA